MLFRATATRVQQVRLPNLVAALISYPDQQLSNHEHRGLPKPDQSGFRIRIAPHSHDHFLLRLITGAHAMSQTLPWQQFLVR
jgi:hypothetical protein